MVVGEFTTEVDVLVLGAGPGGYVAAIRAAQLGKKVTIVEASEVGGVCLNRGCIPSKALISAAQLYEQMRYSQENNMGLVADSVRIDFSKLQQWKEGIVQQLTGGIANLLQGNKVTLVKGEALFTGEDEVRVINGYETERYKFNQCIIATGSLPVELKAFPFGKRVLSSTEALTLPEIPKKLIVIGGGYIGVELGQAYAKFGTKVTIIEGEQQILPIFEKQLALIVQKRLEKLGVEILTNARADMVQANEEQVSVSYTIGEDTQQVEADYLLVTVGRKPNTENLGLDVAKVEINEQGLIEVDQQGRTSNPQIFAIGDVVAGPALAHKASYEGKVAAEAIAGQTSAVDYKVIPSVVFSDPEIAVVGLTEKEAQEAQYAITVGKFPYAANGRALTLNNSEGFIKLIAEKDTGLLLGAQVVGLEASTLITELALAIEMAATLEDVALTIHAHPTLGEMTMEAAEVALGQAIHMLNK